MKVSILKIAKDVLKIIIPDKYAIWIGILSLIIGIPLLYFFDSYIFPGFTYKVNDRLIFKILGISLIITISFLFIGYWIAYKYNITAILEDDKKQDDSSKKTFFVILKVLRWLMLPIVIGLTIQLSWQYFNSIRENKIFLLDADRPSSSELWDISIYPIETRVSWLNRSKLRLCILNDNKKTLKNGILHVYLPKDARVIGGDSWITASKQSAYCNFMNINPNIRLILQPLELEFLGPKIYEINYSISGEDFRTSQKKMLIKVIKKE